MKAYFITATDTEAGKTFITAGLLKSLSQKGFKTLGFKPVASGCHRTVQGLQNEDALQIIEAANVSLDYAQINPYVFEPAIAPHIAAAEAGIEIDLSVIVDTVKKHQHRADFVLVEGVGGWLVPLNSQQNVADLARQLDFPVIVVVNMRLGCINHALLTIRAIEQQGLIIAGWIANQVNDGEMGAAEPMPRLQENIQSLKARIAAPLLGIVPDLRSEGGHQDRLLSDFVDLDKCIY